MIDLDRLEQRLDLALEAELRRHLGLDDGGSEPPAPSWRDRRQRRATERAPENLAPVPASRPEPSIPAWPPAPTPPRVGPEPDEPAPVAARPEPRPAPKPEPAVTARQPFERRADRPSPPRAEQKVPPAEEKAPAPRPERPKRPAVPTSPPGRSAFEKREDRPPGLLQLRLREKKRTGLPLRPETAPAPVAEPEHHRPAPGSDDTLQRHASQVVELIGQGRIYDADEHISAHAELAAKSGGPQAQRDAAAWAVMRALVEGRHRDARRQLDDVRRLGEVAGDAAAADVHAWQRFWLLIEWGSDAELDELLDFCRQRAYFENDLRWRAALTLLLARTGYAEESAREFDMVMEKALNGLTNDGDWLDIMTNAGEAAAVLGDQQRARTAYGALGRSSGTTATVGRAWVCKGSTARVLGLLAATAGRPSESDRHFGVAMDKHRDMEALPLLARTCTEWGLSLAGRESDEADEYLDEGFELANRLRMTGLADRARAGLDELRQPIAS